MEKLKRSILDICERFIVRSDAEIWPVSGLVRLLEGHFRTGTSQFLSENEHSVAGQLLFALLGYEATPQLSQVIAYICSMAALFCVAMFSFIKRDRN